MRSATVVILDPSGALRALLGTALHGRASWHMTAVGAHRRVGMLGGDVAIVVVDTGAVEALDLLERLRTGGAPHPRVLLADEDTKRDREALLRAIEARLR